MLERKDLQKEWEKIVHKGSLKYTSLSKNERIWFNIEPIANEGLIGHYMNYGADKNFDLIEDLNYLGLFGISELFLEINNLFTKKKPPENIDERNEEIYNWSISNKDLLEINEREFWKKVDVIEKKLLEHINKNILISNK